MLNDAFFNAWTPRALGLLRIVTGYLFITHGTAKLLGMPHVKMFDGLQILSLAGVAGILELVGGALIILGLFTRPVAFVLSGTMAAAYFIAHNTPFFSPMLNGGEAAYLFCFIFLFIAAAGPGRWSVDVSRARAGVPRFANA